jgi:hypothetical protein
MENGLSVRGLLEDVNLVQDIIFKLLREVDIHAKDVADGQALVAANEVKPYVLTL